MRAWSGHIICSSYIPSVLLFQSVTDLNSLGTPIRHFSEWLILLLSFLIFDERQGRASWSATQSEDDWAFMPSSELISKLRWKFPVVFVRTCSTELLRPEESTCVRDPQNLFLNQRFAAVSLFTRFSPGPHFSMRFPYQWFPWCWRSYSSPCK